MGLARIGIEERKRRLSPFYARSPPSGKIQCSIYVITRVSCTRWRLVKVWVYPITKPLHARSLLLAQHSPSCLSRLATKWFNLSLQQLVSDDESADEYELLKTLSTKQKKKLLKKLKALNKQDKKKKRKKSKREESDSTSSSSSSEDDVNRKKRRHRKKRTSDRRANAPDANRGEHREIVDPETLLKEITKGLKVDFVGNDNPFANSNGVKIKRERGETPTSERRSVLPSTKIKREDESERRSNEKKSVEESSIDDLLKMARSASGSSKHFRHHTPTERERYRRNDLRDRLDRESTRHRRSRSRDKNSNYHKRK